MEFTYKWQRLMFEEYTKLTSIELLDKLADMAWTPYFPQNKRDEWEWILLKELLKERIG